MPPPCGYALDTRYTIKFSGAWQGELGMH
jgi:hypothetical protein